MVNARAEDDGWTASLAAFLQTIPSLTTLKYARRWRAE